MCYDTEQNTYMEESEVNAVGLFDFGKGKDKTKKESDISLKYYQTIQSEIKPMESKMVELVVLARDSKRVNERITSLAGAIKMYYQLEKVCRALGSDYEKYFADMWKSSYVEKLENELQELQSNYGELVKWEAAHDKESVNLERKVISLLRASPGILQTEAYKHFGPTVKDDIRSIIYFLAKNGQIDRLKSGSTYKIYWK